MKRCLLILLLLFSGMLQSSGLDLDSLSLRARYFSQWCSPEKLYVHMDRTCYAAGETIWFKGYLRDAFRHSKMESSKFIYVEILDTCGNPLLRHKIKRDSTGFPGSVYIPEDFRSGDYAFRAYTKWQMNSDADYMFNQRIKIAGAYPRKKAQGVDSLSTVDVSFYPEGGRYFYNNVSSISFKVMDSKGGSLDFEGGLYEDSGIKITDVSTVLDGMGRFFFMPLEAHEYYLMDLQGHKYPLPNPSKTGVSANLRFDADSITVHINGKYNGAVTLMLAGNENNVPLAVMEMGANPLRFRFPLSMASVGINHILLLNDGGKILSDRKFFRYDDKTPVCELDSIKNTHKTLKPISAVLNLKDKDGNPISGNCSMSITRGSFKKYHQDDGIGSYMLLSSELKGHINAPYHYFDPEIPIETRLKHMDLLMTVQGWNYYDMETLTSTGSHIKIKYQREYFQTIKGKVLNPSGKKVPSKYSFILVVPKLRFSTAVDVGIADSFLIDSIDFVENTKFLISINRKGLGLDYIPKWSGDCFADVYEYSAAAGRGRAVAQAVQEALPVMYEGVVVDTLKAAVVTAKADDDPFASFYGHNISQDEMAFFRDYNVVEYILYRIPRFEYNGDSMYNRMALRAYSAIGIEDDDAPEDDGADYGNRRGEVKLLDDGTETVWWPYESVYVSDIVSLNISTHPEPLHNADGGLVSIKVNPWANKGAGERSILCFIPLGYQKPTEFYSPRYDQGARHEVYDHRNTILWRSDLQITDGRAEFGFCDTDQQDYPYYVVLEGVSEDGTPFSGRAVIR